jgi:hypothetical protein
LKINKAKFAQGFLVLAAIMAGLTALAHLSCIVLGPQCFAAQRAPEQIIQSAIDGTWLAPIGTIVLSGMFLCCSAYALSKAKIIRPIPLTNAAVYTIAVLCLARGLLAFQLKLRIPERLDTLDLNIAIAWFVTGLLFLIGAWWMPKTPKGN